MLSDASRTGSVFTRILPACVFLLLLLGLVYAWRLDRQVSTLTSEVESLKQVALQTRSSVQSENPALKLGQRTLALHYRDLIQRGEPLPPLRETGYRIYSQADEDGLLQFIFAILGTTRGTFIDIGSGDGFDISNVANLALNFGWYGLCVDMDEAAIKRGLAFYHSHPDTLLHPPKFVAKYVTRENINRIIKRTGFEGEVDLLTIDIDGDDYWVWQALESATPRVVIIEVQLNFGARSIVVPYHDSYKGKHPSYFGASPVAMTKLAHEKGYRLVGSNVYGFNLIFVRNGLADDLLPEQPIESVMAQAISRADPNAFEGMKHLPFVEVP